MSVDFCNWCPDPHHPSAVHHPGGQCEHLAGDGITDDRAAIHVRLAAGKFVVLPSGTYLDGGDGLFVYEPPADVPAIRPVRPDVDPTVPL